MPNTSVSNAHVCLYMQTEDSAWNMTTTVQSWRFGSEMDFREDGGETCAWPADPNLVVSLQTGSAAMTCFGKARISPRVHRSAPIDLWERGVLQTRWIQA